MIKSSYAYVLPICLNKFDLRLDTLSHKILSFTFKSNWLTPIPVDHPVPAGFSSVIPILRQIIPAPEIAQTCPGSLETETCRKPCFAVTTDESKKNFLNYF